MTNHEDRRDEFDALLAQPLPDRSRGRYRLVDDDALALVTDEVIVSIAADPLTGRLLNAGISWPERIAGGDRLEAGWKRPQFETDIPVTLLEAEVLAAQLGLSGVAISMDPVLSWDPDWGELTGP